MNTETLKPKSKLHGFLVLVFFLIPITIVIWQQIIGGGGGIGSAHMNREIPKILIKIQIGVAIGAFLWLGTALAFIRRFTNLLGNKTGIAISIVLLELVVLGATFKFWLSPLDKSYRCYSHRVERICEQLKTEPKIFQK